MPGPQHRPPTGDRFTLARARHHHRPPARVEHRAGRSPNVSRNHAEIRPQGDGFLLVDLGSTNGSKVNGVRVDQRMLNDGDELTFGNTRMRFEAS